MMCALTDLSVLLYSQSPNREFLSGICNILCRSKQSHRNNNKTVFDMWRGCSDGFKTFGRTAGSSIGFQVLKETSHSNGSSEALRCPPPPKGWPIVSASAQTRRPRLHLCCSWRYRCGSFGGLDPGNQRDFKPRRHPLNGARERLLPSTAFLSPWRLETQTRGNTGAFRCFSVSLSSNACNIMYCRGYNVLLIPMQK